MAVRSVLVAGVASVVLTSTALVSPALASAGHHPSPPPPDYPPKADRIAATTATYNAIEAKIAAGQSLRVRATDATAQSDIIDYGVEGLWSQGIDGAGVTVAEIVTNPDPNLPTTVANYSTLLNLPPANVSELAYPPPTDPDFTCVVECSAGEDQLDAEAIHSMAPYADILFVHPSVPETIGTQGWPQVAAAIEYVADHHLADIITVSLGDGESDFIDDPLNPTATQAAAIHSVDPAVLDAAAKSVPVLFASGDCGATDPPVLSDTGQCTPAIGLTAGHMADNPWVTAVGGTIPNSGLATAGGRTAPDALWISASGRSDAEGAGISAVYPKPSWEKDVPALDGITGYAYPDITADSSNGTSQASPTFAGILALATQLRHHDLGTVNPAIFKLGPKGTTAGIIDVPAGYTNASYGVTGYTTATGYDIASGWGNVWAPDFVPALVNQLNKQHGRLAPSSVARSELSQLEANIHVSARTVTAGKTVTVTGSGFVPGSTPNGTGVKDGYGVYPGLPGEYDFPSGGPFYDPTSTVPGQPWDTLSATLAGPSKKSPVTSLAVAGADGNGKVTLSIDTTGLAPGTYTVTITGLLLTQKITFEVQKARHGKGGPGGGKGH